jgi:hypothetical protein
MHMRRSNHWTGVICLLFGLLSLLLLLSALIQAPAEDAAPVVNTIHTVDAILLPAAQPVTETASDAHTACAAFLSIAFLALLASAAPRLVSGIDANGRVLRRRRYVRSYYPVFKQELACG